MNLIEIEIIKGSFGGNFQEELIIIQIMVNSAVSKMRRTKLLIQKVVNLYCNHNCIVPENYNN